MLVPWQSLREEIRDFVVARDMLDAELVALDPALRPMKTHVDAFRQARRDRPIGQAHGDLVIAKEECGGLRVAKVVQDGALDARCLRDGRQRRGRHTQPPVRRNRLRG